MKYKALTGVVGLALALGVSSQALACHTCYKGKTVNVMGQIKTNLHRPIFFSVTKPLTVSNWNGKTKTFWLHFPKKMGTTSSGIYFYLKKPDGKPIPLCVYSFKVTYNASYNGHMSSLMFSKAIKATSKHKYVKCRFGLDKKKITFYIMGQPH